MTRGLKHTSIALVTTVSLLISGLPAFAEERTATASPAPRNPGVFSTTAIERVARALPATNAVQATTAQLFRAQSAPVKPKRGVGARIAWAAVGGAGGFFGGGFLGAAIEGDRCECDDPGLMGFLIGAPVGAATGSILGWFLSK